MQKIHGPRFSSTGAGSRPTAQASRCKETMRRKGAPDCSWAPFVPQGSFGGKQSVGIIPVSTQAPGQLTTHLSLAWGQV